MSGQKVGWRVKHLYDRGDHGPIHDAKLRWKRHAAETGLRSIGAPPRGYEYHNGSDEFATIEPNGGGWQRPQNGWYWVAHGNGIPYKNTYNDPPCETVEQAKKEASEYVKAHLRKDQP